MNKKRVIVSGIAGTLLLFIWNAISWLVIPLHSNSVNNIPDQAIRTELLQQYMPASGVYHYPGLPDGTQKSRQAVTEKLKAGPRITLMVYQNKPTQLFDPMTYLSSLLINFLTVALLLFIIAQFGQSKPVSIILGTTAIGGVVAVVADLGQMNWFMLPLNYTLANTIDHIVPFLLLGLLFAKYTFRKIY